jgi:predicted transcriptional regulator of viral defense system
MILAELFSRKDCVKRFGSDYFTAQEISAGRLFRIEKGVFAERMHVPELALLSWKYPKAVITMLSAFYHYGLTDVIPEVCDLATD